ncbi:ribokinase-like protein [Pseudovirgaria hyperparasitica]|uniref:Ribokinase n=1 Tax=Pseudovirgaria hyperparasitica TaxID=470096 RepID=A0A6A6VW25_9PEZI|nr:ribokinase-like protein [Pseudovirgaria hyperparasitica]KAF2754888.1 ribokinase-like protein [Pseudovirgaria hyperparasitica]
MSTPSIPSIAVIGSLNVDLVTRTPRIPAGGETLASKSFNIGFGGKGANQAVACARLSRTKVQAAQHAETDVAVQMVGAVGTDTFADDFLTSLKEDGLDVSLVEKVGGLNTGVAVILVEEDTGENRILISPGANEAIRPQGLLPKGAGVAVFQLEIPKDVVFATMAEAKKKGTIIILNPAPAIPLPKEVFHGLHHLIVNESEAAILSHRSPDQINPDADLSAIAGEFIDAGVGHVIITLGSHGVFFQTATKHQQRTVGTLIPAEPVPVVDTTAAGDTFVGAYAVSVARASHGPNPAKFDIASAVAFANRAASITVQRPGAQSAIPWLDEVSMVQ